MTAHKRRASYRGTPEYTGCLRSAVVASQASLSINDFDALVWLRLATGVTVVQKSELLFSVR